MTFPITHTCPYCGSRHDAANPFTSPPRAPQEGDFALCIECGEFSTLEDNKLRCVTRNEMLLIALDADCFMAWLAWVRSHPTLVRQ